MLQNEKSAARSIDIVHNFSSSRYFISHSLWITTVGVCYIQISIEISLFRAHKVYTQEECLYSIISIKNITITMTEKNVLKKGPRTFYIKKVVSGKLIEIEICCNLEI